MTKLTKLTKSMEMVKMVKMVMQKLSKLYEYGTSNIYARTGRSKQSGRQEEKFDVGEGGLKIVMTW